MSDRLLTMTEIADRIGIPESTARYYRKKFNEYIEGHGDGRHRRYKASAVQVMQIIADGFKSNKTVIEITKQLDREFPKTVDIGEESQNNIAAVQQQSVVHVNDRFLQLYAAQEERITQLERMVINAAEQAAAAREEAIEAKEYIETSIKERDRRLLEYIRNQQQQQKPWWKLW